MASVKSLELDFVTDEYDNEIQTVLEETVGEIEEVVDDNEIQPILEETLDETQDVIDVKDEVQSNGSIQEIPEVQDDLPIQHPLPPYDEQENIKEEKDEKISIIARLLSLCPFFSGKKN